ncbi:MAG: ABC transporter substrate-binding protein [Thermoanaerobacteraceae bacterium]|nr:ABC transporter substrate-binding protein [Thermoanaerobacteraceae bacterium]
MFNRYRRSRWYRFLCLLTALTLVVSFTGCAKKESGKPAAEEEVIKLGCVLSMSGDLAAMGKKMADAVKLAVEEINQAGGVNGKQIKLYLEDDATDPATCLNAVKKLVELNDVKLIIGGMTSGGAKTAGPYVFERKVLLVSPSATSPELTGQPWREYFFRTCPSDTFQGKVMAQLAVDEGLKKAVILAMDNPYGVGLGEVIESALAGKAEVLSVIKYDPNKKDYLTELTQIKNLNPDCVFHIGYNDDGRVIYKQALNLGLDKIRWIGCDGVYGTGMFATQAAAEFMAKAVLGTRPASPEGGKYEEFRQAYKAEYNSEPEVYCDTVYDAAQLIAEACAKAGSADPAKVREALVSVGQGYEGASGTITFDSQGDRVSGVYEVWKVVKKDGEYSFERVKLAEAQ